MNRNAVEEFGKNILEKNKKDNVYTGEDENIISGNIIELLKTRERYLDIFVEKIVKMKIF